MMKSNRFKYFICIVVILAFPVYSLILAGCTNNMTPVNPTPSIPPSRQFNENEIKVVYNYDNTNKVQLSNNNLMLKIGQKLILEPAQGLTKITKFSSAGETFIGNIMERQEEQSTGRVVFIATKPGKGMIKIIPNQTEVDRATELWVTVVQ